MSISPNPNSKQVEVTNLDKKFRFSRDTILRDEFINIGIMEFQWWHWWGLTGLHGIVLQERVP